MSGRVAPFAADLQLQIGVGAYPVTVRAADEDRGEAPVMVNLTLKRLFKPSLPRLLIEIEIEI